MYISSEHREYLKKIKKEKFFVFLMKVLILLFFLGLWEYAAQKSYINTFLYSSPSKICNTLLSLFQKGDLFQHIWITLYEVFISFFLAFGIGLFIAFLLWRFSLLAKILDPYLTILNSLPKVALGPLILIWMGAGIHSIVFMSLLINLFTTILSIYSGFISVPEKFLTLFRSFGAKPRQIFWKLVFPYNFEIILSTLKITISMSFIGLLPPVGEKIFFNKCYSRY